MKKMIGDGDRDLEEGSLDPHFIKSLVSHGLTSEEMKRIFKEIRVRWWRRDENRIRKDLR